MMLHISLTLEIDLKPYRATNKLIIKTIGVLRLNVRCAAGWIAQTKPYGKCNRRFRRFFFAGVQRGKDI